MKKSILPVIGLAFVAACHGPSLDVGANADGGTNDGSSGAGMTTWSGYFESYNLPSGSDHLTLKLAVASNGTVTGTALLGDPPLLDPPTNPDVGYPAPVLADGGGAPNMYEHFEFTIRNGLIDVQESRFTFTLHLNEIETAWCQLQTKIYPFLNGGNGDLLGYACLPNAGHGNNMNGPGCFWHDDATNQDVQVDCNKLALCGFGGPCSCTATSCTVDPNNANSSIAFDLHMAGDAADGSVDGLRGGSVIVHLTKK